jgi:hypothetical protein
MDIGMDLGATVTGDYHDKAPFAFTGRFQTVTVEHK